MYWFLLIVCTFILDFITYSIAEQQLLFSLLGLITIALFLAPPFIIYTACMMIALQTILTTGQWGIALLYLIPVGIAITTMKDSLAIPLVISISVSYLLTLILHLSITNTLALTTYTFLTICANLVLINGLLKFLDKGRLDNR